LRNDAQEGEASAFGSAGQSAGRLGRRQARHQEPEEDQGQDAQETAAIAAAARGSPRPDAGGGRQTVLNTAANVRSRANKSGKVLGAVPAGVKVSSYGCRSSWCEVSYKGLRGWVYSGFVLAMQSKAGRQQAKGDRRRLASARNCRCSPPHPRPVRHCQASRPMSLADSPGGPTNPASSTC
jgi:hypothetical protein